MLVEDVDSDNCMVEIQVSALYHFIVLMFLIFHSIKPFEHKLKECTQIFRTRARHKYIGVPVSTHKPEIIDRCTKMPYPNATAAAIARPRVADLPRPRDAVIDMVVLRVCSDTASTTFRSAFA